jgi:hypothetical protein
MLNVSATIGKVQFSDLPIITTGLSSMRAIVIAGNADRVVRDEPLVCLPVVARPVEVQPRCVVSTAGELIGIGDRSGAGGRFERSIGIVSVARRYRCNGE